MEIYSQNSSGKGYMPGRRPGNLHHATGVPTNSLPITRVTRSSDRHEMTTVEWAASALRPKDPQRAQYTLILEP